MIKIWFNVLVVILLLSSCAKVDRLEGEFNRLEGKYEWIYSDYVYSSCALCSRHYRIDSASKYDYTAQIEFNNEGEVIFYIDNEELVRQQYSIKDQYIENDDLYLDLRVDVDEKILDIKDELEVYSIDVDTIYLQRFPHSGYKETQNKTNYFVRMP